jgi:hypothetical protein
MLLVDGEAPGCQRRCDQFTREVSKRIVLRFRLCAMSLRIPHNMVLRLFRFLYYCLCLHIML